MENLDLTKDKFKTLPVNAFSVWYEQAYKNLKLIADHLKKDLIGFENQSGTNILAFFSVRIKGKESFVDKIDKLRRDEKEVNNLFTNQERILQVQDIIKDLIGARLVFYFYNELHWAINYFSKYPTFKIEQAEAYQILPDDSPLAGKYRENLFARIQEIVRDFHPKPKRSSYESIHLIVRYQEPFKTTRTLVTESPAYRRSHIEKWKKGSRNESELTLFPIEVQIRTILEHTWAQIEHRMIYSPRKMSSSESIDDPLFAEDFQCHKMLLNSAETHQRIMFDRFWNLRLQPPKMSSKGSIEVSGFELQYFNQEEARNISKINMDIDGKDAIKALQELKDMIIDLESKYEQEFLSLTFEDDIRKWGRKRLILISIAYVLLNGDEKTRERVYKIFQDKIRRSTLEPYLFDEISLYEYIRNIDAFFRIHPSVTIEQKQLVSDPSVFYRCAGAYLKIGDLRRSIHLLKEVLDHHYLDDYPVGDRADKILTEMHFLRRIGEYYHFVYLRDGQVNHDDLVNACNFMNKAYNCQKGPKNQDNYNLEFSKTLSNLIVLYFSRYLLQEYENKEGFRVKMTELEPNVRKHFHEEGILKNKRVHASEALAIYKFYKNDMEGAKKLISMSLKNVEQKTKNPFFHLTTNQIYQYFHQNRDQQ